MKTVSMWSFSGGSLEIGVHDVEPELFEKLRPAFDRLESLPEGLGRISFDENTSILLFKNEDGKEARNEVPAGNAEGE